MGTSKNSSRKVLNARKCCASEKNIQVEGGLEWIPKINRHI